MTQVLAAFHPTGCGTDRWDGRRASVAIDYSGVERTLALSAYKSDLQ